MPVVGAKELMEKLSTIDKKVQRKIVRDGLAAGGEVILRSIAAEAPVLTGLMKSKLAVLAGKGRRGQIVKRVGFRKSAKLVSISKAGKRYFYPSAVEFGHGAVEGKHFIQQAEERTETEAIEVARTVIARGIEQAAK